MKRTRPSLAVRSASQKFVFANSLRGLQQPSLRGLRFMQSIGLIPHFACTYHFSACVCVCVCVVRCVCGSACMGARVCVDECACVEIVIDIAWHSHGNIV